VPSDRQLVLSASYLSTKRTESLWMRFSHLRLLADMDAGKSTGVHSKAVDNSILGITAKRKLPAEPSSDDRITKRRRSRNTSDPSQFLAARTGKFQANCQGHDVKVDYAKGNGAEDPVQSSSEESETSSSSSDVEDTSEASSSDDQEETSLTQMAKPPSPDKDATSAEVELIQDLPLPEKPPISVPNSASDLHSRLSSFLPELQKANTDLQNSAEAMARRLDEVADDEEHYIEMNLGLGVLKEKKSGAVRAEGVKLRDEYSTSSTEDSGSDSMESRDAVEEQNVDGDPLADMMGGKPPRSKVPKIQEVPGS
jgi:Domain of unknown function (DUF4598)